MNLLARNYVVLHADIKYMQVAAIRYIGNLCLIINIPTGAKIIKYLPLELFSFNDVMVNPVLRVPRIQDGYGPVFAAAKHH